MVPRVGADIKIVIELAGGSHATPAPTQFTPTQMKFAGIIAVVLLSNEPSFEGNIISSSHLI